jgi:hypothetical protein
MKFLALATFLAVSTTALAATESSIYDVMYLPKVGTTYGISEIGLVNGSATGDNFDLDISGYVFNQTIGHALTERLSLQVATNYTNLKNDISYSLATGEDDETETQSGLGDLALDARYRLMDEKYLLDIVGGADLSFSDQEEKANGDQNNASGGHVLRLGAQLGQKRERFQWAVLGQFERALRAQVDVSGGDDYKNDAHNIWSLEGSILNQISEKAFLRSKAGFRARNKYDDSVNDTTPSDTQWQIGTEYQHLMSQDLLLRGGLSYNVSHRGDYSDFSYWALYAGANYQF